VTAKRWLDPVKFAWSYFHPDKPLPEALAWWRGGPPPRGEE
jgi:hypothetical protein